MHAGTALVFVIRGPEFAIEFLLLLRREQSTHPPARL
jgi:hypothetical protein